MIPVPEGGFRYPIDHKMKWLDVILLLPLVWGLLCGLMKGFVVSVGSFAGLVAGIYVAGANADSLAGRLTEWFTLSPRQLYVVAYLLIFVGVALLCLLLSRLAAHLFRQLSMAWLDKTLGAVFGFFKYALIMSVLVNLVEIVDVRLRLIDPETKVHSVAYMPLRNLVPEVLPYVHFYLDEYHEATETE